MWWIVAAVALTVLLSLTFVLWRKGGEPERYNADISRTVRKNRRKKRRKARGNGPNPPMGRFPGRGGGGSF